MIIINFTEIYREDKTIIDKYIPRDVIARLLGKQDMALKCEYNRLLKCEKELAEILDDEQTPIGVKEQEVRKYIAITDRLSIILNELKKMGVSVSDLQIENGF